MFRSLFCTAALVTGLAVSGPALAQDDPGIDTVMATIGDTEITLGHMLALRASLPAQYDQLPAEVLFQGVLDQLVQQELLRQAHEGEMSRSAALRLANEERAILAADVAATVVNADVSPEQLQAAYDAQYAEATPGTEYQAAHILVETEETARELKTSLDEGANFTAMAQEHSTGPSGPSGGDLGWFGEGVMVPAFFDAVTALEVGTVSDPVQTQFGWHLIKLNETRLKDRPALDEVRDELVDALRQAAFEEYIAELTAAAGIERAGTDGMDPALINRTDMLEN